MKTFFKAFLALILLLVGAMPLQAQAQDVKTYIHPRAIELYPSMRKELPEVFPAIPIAAYPLALIELESCITLKHPRCFSVTSELKTYWADGTARENGVGLPQITRAWKQDGTVRMDTLASLKKLYPIQLKGVTWDTIRKSPDEQIRVMLLLLQDDYKNLYVIPNPTERLKFTDSAYNGGRKDALAARKVCGLAKGCDPNVWFGNVEKYSVKSENVLYGGRSPKEINNHHVRDVFLTRMPKFQKSFKFHSALGEKKTE